VYSQYFEEEHILAACSGIDNGRYLDIGAYHPTEKSNTRALFEWGWSGVMLEPSPDPMLSLIKVYGDEPRVTLIAAAAGLEPGLVKLHVTADAVSTTNEAQREVWKDAGGYYGSIMVPVLLLEDITTRFGGFDFINFDSEGSSVDLFKRALALGLRPRCYCVEYDQRMDEMCIAATAAGYVLTHSNGTNAIWRTA
jgi:FkbM family methyltransferase